MRQEILCTVLFRLSLHLSYPSHYCFFIMGIALIVNGIAGVKPGSLGGGFYSSLARCSGGLDGRDRKKPDTVRLGQKNETLDV